MKTKAFSLDRRLLLPLLLFSLAACQQGGDESGEPKPDESASGSGSEPGVVEQVKSPDPGAGSEVREIGGKTSDRLMKSLGSQLKAALQGGGPVEAIRVCQQVAMPLTEASEPSGEVSVRRTTLRPRNPANAPDPTDRKVLEKMAADLAATGSPPEPVVEWTEEAGRFYRPLIIQEVCLNCHGDPAAFSPELGDALAELYPEDRATGYSLGDLRGVIRVDVARD